MTNGSNDWGVAFSDIQWLGRLLTTHQNVRDVTRSRDILFEVARARQADRITVVCLRQYVMGITLVQRVLSEFPDVSIIYIGGGWSRYTAEAKEFCLERHIGLYVTDEMSGALWSNEFWAFCKRDEKGDPAYFLGTEEH